MLLLFILVRSQILKKKPDVSSPLPKATYEEWFVQLFITAPANANAHSLDIIMDNYIEVSVKKKVINEWEILNPEHITGCQQKMPQGQRWLNLISV